MTPKKKLPPGQKPEAAAASSMVSETTNSKPSPTAPKASSQSFSPKTPKVRNGGRESAPNTANSRNNGSHNGRNNGSPNGRNKGRPNGRNNRNPKGRNRRNNGNPKGQNNGGAAPTKSTAAKKKGTDDPNKPKVFGADGEREYLCKMFVDFKESKGKKGYDPDMYNDTNYVVANCKDDSVLQYFASRKHGGHAKHEKNNKLIDKWVFESLSNLS